MMSKTMTSSAFLARAAARPSMPRAFRSNGSRVCMKSGNWLPGATTPSYLEDLPA